jgi:hypothetical protein
VFVISVPVLVLFCVDAGTNVTLILLLCDIKVREVATNMIFQKICERLCPESTVTIRVALKRFVEEDRAVTVWEAIMEGSGTASLRFRQRGWGLKRRPRSTMEPVFQGHPVTIEQLCVRITPEVLSQRDVSNGALHHLLAGAYHRHMKVIAQTAEKLLTARLNGLSLE